jgi:ABC-2 type transport system permease protein
MVNISVLWTVAGDGMMRIFPAVMMLLSGVLVPLAYFPDWMQAALRFLPFSSLVDIPTNFYLGTIPASGIFTYGLLQAFWTAAFILIGMQLFTMGARKVVVQGG